MPLSYLVKQAHLDQPRAMRHFLFLLLATFSIGCTNNTTTYFNQTPPTATPELFAPSVVNTESIELNVVFNDGRTEMFFSRIVDSSFVIHHSEFIDGRWSDITPLQMYPAHVELSVACDPTLTQDGNTMYFLGVDPELYTNDVTRKELYTIPPDIYMSTKVDGNWQLASKVDFGVSTEFIDTYPVVTADGSLYFKSNRPSEAGGMNTYRAQYLGNNEFAEPEIVTTKSEQKELIAYVSPDEQYAITNGQGTFQITFNENGGWTKPIEVPLPYESDWLYYCPYMTPDGAYFIFSRRYNTPGQRGWAGVEKGEVYWVSADVLFNMELR